MILFVFFSIIFSTSNDHSTIQEEETSSCLKEDAPKDLACFPLLQEENEEECTSSFLVGELQITTKFVGLFMDEYIYFVSYPKDDYKSELQSPQEPHKEEENKAAPLGCEP